jgi:hypothetical protein
MPAYPKCNMKGCNTTAKHQFPGREGNVCLIHYRELQDAQEVNASSTCCATGCGNPGAHTVGKLGKFCPAHYRQWNYRVKTGKVPANPTTVEAAVAPGEIMTRVSGTCSEPGCSLPTHHRLGGCNGPPYCRKHYEGKLRQEKE